MNKDINYALMSLVPVLNANGENVKKIEAVEDWYKGANDKRYCKEVAEITYKNGCRRYADIGCDSNLAAVYDVLGVLLSIKPQSDRIELIKRGMYEFPREII